MTKIKFGIVAMVMLVSNLVFAQSLDDARKLIDYQRYASAVEALEKMAAASATSPDVHYWLGQAHIEAGNVQKAKEVYRKGLEANGSSPILLVGMGHVELLESNVNEARQRFETAISLTKAKDINVLNAIGKANVDKNGDLDYAIEKLTLATTIKGFKEPDVYINMGNAYRKKNDGGGAVKAYQNALTINPKSAMANYRTGKIYLTQGKDQEELFTKFFNDAIAADAKFAPAFYDFYVYFFFRDVYKAKTFFNQYKELADKGAALDYEEASLSYAASEFKESIAKADELLKKYGASVDPRVYRLKAYSHNQLADSVVALSNMEEDFSRVPEEEVSADNWVVAAELASKVAGKTADFDKYVKKAIASDTSDKGRVNVARKAVAIFKKAGDQAKVAEWAVEAVRVAAVPSKVDIYNAGFENFKAGQYLRADSLFDMYKTRYPNEVYGHYWCFRSLSVVDSTMEQGLAIEDATKFIEVAEADKVKNKATLITAYGYLAGYQANIKKDFAAAIAFLDRIIAVDPANADALKNKEILQAALNRGEGKPAAAPGGEAKTGQ
jgi:tetratricopeptide (TPR) repeat protein